MLVDESVSEKQREAMAAEMDAGICDLCHTVWQLRYTVATLSAVSRYTVATLSAVSRYTVDSVTVAR